jgi:hypothetical protein
MDFFCFLPCHNWFRVVIVTALSRLLHDEKTQFWLMLLVWLLLVWLLLLSARCCSQLVDVDMTLLPVLLLSATDFSLYWFDGWSCRFFENKWTHLFFAMSQLASSCNGN